MAGLEKCQDNRLSDGLHCRTSCPWVIYDLKTRKPIGYPENCHKGKTNFRPETELGLRHGCSCSGMNSAVTGKAYNPTGPVAATDFS